MLVPSRVPYPVSYRVHLTLRGMVNTGTRAQAVRHGLACESDCRHYKPGRLNLRG